MVILLLALAAGCGACVRYFITNVGKMLWPTLPLATLLINCLGAFFFAILSGLLLPASAQLILMTGFCGGFTTFSTYMADTVVLLRQRQFGRALAYYLGTPVLGMGAYWVGTLIRI